MAEKAVEYYTSLAASRCPGIVLEGAEDRITAYFWSIVNTIQQEVLLNSPDNVLKDNSEVKGILEDMLYNCRREDGLGWRGNLEWVFQQSYTDLKTVVTRILRENTAMPII